MRIMQLSEKQKKHLRRLAHPLRPLVMLGNAGLTDGVVGELDRALADHELVKVSARVGERTTRDANLEELNTWAPRLLGGLRSLLRHFPLR